MFIDHQFFSFGDLVCWFVSGMSVIFILVFCYVFDIGVFLGLFLFVNFIF